jgi:hypothetical protein
VLVARRGAELAAAALQLCRCAVAKVDDVRAPGGGGEADGEREQEEGRKGSHEVSLSKSDAG